ncbi:unnamed protein product [Knipowitschia caucasica]|uniref:WD repeat domain 73 n=1 Tax=Knipowitschia caucasica TaxID=637954 RepID=A0AAV2MEE0_KNICA
MLACDTKEDCDDTLDEWFIHSLKTYTDLHVYQLEHPTRVLEWTSGKTVCVAGFSPANNEILELSLPLRLLAEQNKGLRAERDFKILHGGFCEVPVHSFKHVPGTRCAVSNDGCSSSLQLWDLGGAHTDVIRRTGQIHVEAQEVTGGRKVCAPLSHHTSGTTVLHGAMTSDVQLTNISTGQLLCSLHDCPVSQPLSHLRCLSDGTFAVASVDGSILLWDTRSAARPQLRSDPLCILEPGPWTADVLGNLALLSSTSGQTLVLDLRGSDSYVSRAQLKAGGGPSRHVSWAPALDNYVALSGVDALVHIYDASLWGVELQPAHSQFEHKGHAISSPTDVITTSHAWHPERAHTLLSAASDASVHVWDWNHQSEPGGSSGPIRE